jgi:glycerol-3-phosphate dehydrogenase (NAD(P)+)
MTDILNTPILVIGAGSWGTALSLVLARNKQDVYLWGHNVEHLHAMQLSHSNENYLPGILFPDNLHIITDLEQPLSTCSDILIAVPSHAFRNILVKIKPFLTEHSRVLWATKGLDPHTSKLLNEVAQEVLGNKIPLAVLSGPSFAKEVANNLPTAVTIATHHEKFAKDLTHRFHNNTFRIYTSNDLIGVQLGGAIKNILAIAAGVSDGLGMGCSARAALLTRGLAEMMRFGLAMGGNQETLMGLSGLGDLILTSTDNQSRNRRFGLALAQDKSTDTALKEIGQVVEGISATAEVFRLSKQLNIEMPITEQVYGVLYQNISPQKTVQQLLARAPKIEN